MQKWSRCYAPFDNIFNFGNNFQVENFLMRLLTAFCATLLGLLAAPPAHAGNAHDNAVIFGDSIVADPLVSEVITGRLSSQPHCPHSPTSYAEIAAKRLGLDSRNFSCAGAQVHMGGPFLSPRSIRPSPPEPLMPTLGASGSPRGLTMPGAGTPRRRWLPL